MAAAGAVGAAGVSAYRAYDELKDAQLQDAAAGTALDKAQAISQDEPDYFWLAIDIVGAIADVVAAGAAFKALRGAMRGVDLADVASLRKLASQCEASKVSPLGRGKVFANALAEAGGDMTATLDQMLEAFRRIVPPPGEERWVEYAGQMAEHMVAEGKARAVGVLGPARLPAARPARGHPRALPLAAGGDRRRHLLPRLPRLRDGRDARREGVRDVDGDAAGAARRRVTSRA